MPSRRHSCAYTVVNVVPENNPGLKEAGSLPGTTLLTAHLNDSAATGFHFWLLLSLRLSLFNDPVQPWNTEA